jgi:hypothetical protein
MLAPVPDDPPKPEPIRFPVVVEANGVRVEVILLLRPGTVVEAAKQPPPLTES